MAEDDDYKKSAEYEAIGELHKLMEEREVQAKKMQASRERLIGNAEKALVEIGRNFANWKTLMKRDGTAPVEIDDSRFEGEGVLVLKSDGCVGEVVRSLNGAAASLMFTPQDDKFSKVQFVFRAEQNHWFRQFDDAGRRSAPLTTDALAKELLLGVVDYRICRPPDSSTVRKPLH